MTLTRMQEIEFSAHEKFGEQAPSEDKLIEFYTHTLPRADGGIFTVPVCIALASLAISGWNAAANEYRVYKAGKNKPPKCPEPGCGRDAVGLNPDGKFYCANRHTW